LGRATLPDLRYAPTATTGTHLTLARLTATTGLTGSRVACSSALGRGMADTGAGVDGVLVGAMDVAFMGAEAGATVAASPADAGLHVVRLAASMVELAVAFTAKHVADSTVAAVEGSTVVADTAADTGKSGFSGALLLR
jgi:hypothetical protein